MLTRKAERGIGRASALAVIAAILAAFSSVQAAEPFYVGTWKIESAQIAPWWTERAAPDPAESKELVGKTVVVSARGISGPRQAACAKPKYRIVTSPPEGLFQGMFDEMHRRDQSVDPQKAAASAGFRGSKWKTLETGCGNELDYHFIDDNTAAFGLNNYIYLLKKH